MYHKPRGSGGVWQQISCNEAIRVTNKGKHLKVVIRALYHESDRTDTGLAQRDWDWEQDLRLKLRLASGEVTEGFSVSKRTVDHVQNVRQLLLPCIALINILNFRNLLSDSICCSTKFPSRCSSSLKSTQSLVAL